MRKITPKPLEVQTSMLDTATPLGDEVPGPVPVPETLRLRRGHAFYPPADIAAQVPRLYTTEKVAVAEKVVWLHYFGPSQDWWIVEANLDGEDAGMAFGYVDLGFGGGEWGSVYLPELEAVQVHPTTGDGRRSPFDVIIERDCYWSVRPFGEVIR